MECIDYHLPPRGNLRALEKKRKEVTFVGGVGNGSWLRPEGETMRDRVQLGSAAAQLKKI
jgi:hypothetical protein